MMGVPAVLTCALAHGRLQLTAFGARDRAFFEVIWWSAPRRQLKRNTLARAIESHTKYNAVFVSALQNHVLTYDTICDIYNNVLLHSTKLR
jgi:hypothetical protein